MRSRRIAKERAGSDRARRSDASTSARPIAEFAAKHRLPAMFDYRTFRGGGRPDGLRRRPSRAVAARRDLRRQDPEGRQARRPARGAAHQVRAGHQPQDRQGARPDDPAVAPAAGGSGDRVMDRRAFLGVAGGLLAAPLAAEAQQRGRSAGSASWASTTASGYARHVEAFRQGFATSATSRARTSPSSTGGPKASTTDCPLAAELVRLKVDVIVTHGDARRPWPPSRRRRRSRSSWRSAATPWRPGSSPAWRGRAGTHRADLLRPGAQREAARAAEGGRARHARGSPCS